MTSCADTPPIVSGDTSCERYRHISANEEQRKHVEANYYLLESWVLQVADHNDEYDKQCVDIVK